MLAPCGLEVLILLHKPSGKGIVLESRDGGRRKALCACGQSKSQCRGILAFVGNTRDLGHFFGEGNRQDYGHLTNITSKEFLFRKLRDGSQISRDARSAQCANKISTIGEASRGCKTMMDLEFSHAVWDGGNSNMEAVGVVGGCEGAHGNLRKKGRGRPGDQAFHLPSSEVPVYDNCKQNLMKLFGWYIKNGGGVPRQHKDETWDPDGPFGFLWRGHWRTERESLQGCSLQVSVFLKELKTLVVQWSLKRLLKRLFSNLNLSLEKSKRNKTPKDFGPEFQLYLIEGTRDEFSDQHSYCFNVEDVPKTFDEAIKSQDVTFWKQAINDKMDSILGNNTWVLADLPPGCKPLGCKWIFKIKLKVDGTIEKFKARLVIQGFRQKSWTYYFDTYASVARISTIRLLIAIASIHNLIIHLLDVKTAILNGESDEKVYMNQPQGFIMCGNENKVCKLIKSLYGLKQAPKKWH
ncbi:zinc finger, CCHC-type containing protein [Tanacetum coccineum]